MIGQNWDGLRERVSEAERLGDYFDSELERMQEFLDSIDKKLYADSLIVTVETASLTEISDARDALTSG